MDNCEHLYDKDYYGNLLTTQHFVEKDLHWTVLPEGTVLPHQDDGVEILGGLLDREGRFVDGSAIHRGMGGGYSYSQEDAEEHDEDVVFLGLWPDVWGHCLTDNIRRLWVLRDARFMERYGRLRFVYVPMYGRALGENFQELLDMLGVAEIRLEGVDTISRFRNVILPDECFWREADGNRLFTKEYREMIDRIRAFGQAHFTETGDRKIYFTYRNYFARRTVGENKLERFFTKQGYRVVSPENYSFAEQLNMLLNCEAFASTVGSGSHNSIFLRNGTTVHLIPRAGFITEYQPALDEVHDLDITYVDSSLSLYADPQRPWEGPFYYLISRNLRECFGQCGRRKAGRLDFMVYRNLAYLMNGARGHSDYYNSVLEEYASFDPEWKPKETLISRLCRRERVRDLITRYLG